MPVTRRKGRPPASKSKAAPKKAEAARTKKYQTRDMRAADEENSADNE